jgi:hypothetical protein
MYVSIYVRMYVGHARATNARDIMCACKVTHLYTHTHTHTHTHTKEKANNACMQHPWAQYFMLACKAMHARIHMRIPANTYVLGSVPLQVYNVTPKGNSSAHATACTPVSDASATLHACMLSMMLIKVAAKQDGAQIMAVTTPQR